MSFVCSLPGSNQYNSIQGHTSVISGSLLDDDQWHSVLIERYRRNVNFTLDHHTQQLRTNGEFDHLDLDYEVKMLCLANNFTFITIQRNASLHTRAIQGYTSLYSYTTSYKQGNKNIEERKTKTIKSLENTIKYKLKHTTRTVANWKIIKCCIANMH